MEDVKRVSQSWVDCPCGELNVNSYPILLHVLLTKNLDLSTEYKRLIPLWVSWYTIIVWTACGIKPLIVLCMIAKTKLIITIYEKKKVTNYFKCFYRLFTFSARRKRMYHIPSNSNRFCQRTLKLNIVANMKPNIIMQIAPRTRIPHWGCARFLMTRFRFRFPSLWMKIN